MQAIKQSLHDVNNYGTVPIAILSLFLLTVQLSWLSEFTLF